MSEEIYRITTTVERNKTGPNPVRFGSWHRAACTYAANLGTGVKVERMTGEFEDVTDEFAKRANKEETGNEK